MGFLEVLTIIFIVLKLMGIIAWSWLIVFSPLIGALALYLIGFLLYMLLPGLLANMHMKKLKKKKGGNKK